MWIAGMSSPTLGFSCLTSCKQRLSIFKYQAAEDFNGSAPRTAYLLTSSCSPYSDGSLRTSVHPLKTPRVSLSKSKGESDILLAALFLSHFPPLNCASHLADFAIVPVMPYVPISPSLHPSAPTLHQPQEMRVPKTPTLELTCSQQSFFGAMGCAAAIVFTSFGASYGMAKSSIGIMASSILRPDLIVRSAALPPPPTYHFLCPPTCAESSRLPPAKSENHADRVIMQISCPRSSRAFCPSMDSSWPSLSQAT